MPSMFYDEDSAKLLFTEAQALGLRPKWLSEYGLFSVQLRRCKCYVFYSSTNLNGQLSNYLVHNKHAARVILQQHKLPNIPFSLPKNRVELKEFFRKHKMIISKPTKGAHSHNVNLITSDSQLNEVQIQDRIFEQYIQADEWRYLVVGDSVVAVHRKEYDSPINNPETVKRISYEPGEWDKKLISTSLKVASAFSLKLAAVDYLIDSQGKAYVLEVNSAPGIYRFHHPDKGPSINFARMILEAI